LKLIPVFASFWGALVLTPLPEKQGLKQNLAYQYEVCPDVLTPLPEKQGLKHNNDIKPVSVSARINATSRKTRIETMLGRFVNLCVFVY